MTGDLSGLAAEAFVYGYPLVYDVTTVTSLSKQGMASLPAAPFNVFAHAPSLAGPESKFVSVNNDTLYSIAQLDFSGGPLRLDVPDTDGKYYVLQFVDAWTNNFAYIGRRATGTSAGSFLLVPPGWKGKAGELAVIESPTMVASIVGRVACDGPSDLANVARIQQGLTLTPLDRGASLAGVPEPADDVPEQLKFMEQLRTYLAAFPPSITDRQYQQRFAPLGLLDPQTPYRNLPAERAEAITAGLAKAKQALEEYVRHGGAVTKSGWSSTLHIFNYNTDHLGPGTVDDPQWKISERAEAFQTRMVAARAALWGNHGYEAAYPSVAVDSDGHQLNGSSSYTLTFAELPPVGAFWSLTMYDTPDYYLVPNPIDRYSIGDRTEGLAYGSDGSLTIVMQHDRPADAAEAANWLPTPTGDFRPILRLYQPGKEILDGAYELPPVLRRSTGG